MSIGLIKISKEYITEEVLLLFTNFFLSVKLKLNQKESGVFMIATANNKLKNTIIRGTEG